MIDHRGELDPSEAFLDDTPNPALLVYTADSTSTYNTDQSTTGDSLTAFIYVLEVARVIIFSCDHYHPFLSRRNNPHNNKDNKDIE